MRLQRMGNDDVREAYRGANAGIISGSNGLFLGVILVTLIARIFK